QSLICSMPIHQDRTFAELPLEKIEGLGLWQPEHKPVQKSGAVRRRTQESLCVFDLCLILQRTGHEIETLLRRKICQQAYSSLFDCFAFFGADCSWKRDEFIIQPVECIEEVTSVQLLRPRIVTRRI